MVRPLLCLDNTENSLNYEYEEKFNFTMRSADRLYLAIYKGNAQTQTVANDQKLVYPYTFAPSEGLVNQTEKEHRQEICINGYWDFQPVRLPKEYVQGKGIAPELPLPENDSEWSKTRIKIPSPWNINAFAYRDLEGPDHRNYPSYPKEWEQVKMAWMKKNVTILPTGRGNKSNFT